MTSAYKLMKERGVPTEGCMRYEAKDMQCIEINLCRDCGHDYPCRPVQNYTKYFVEEYGYVSGEERMMKEIYARGPITCAIDATEELEAYNDRERLHRWVCRTCRMCPEFRAKRST